MLKHYGIIKRTLMEYHMECKCKTCGREYTYARKGMSYSKCNSCYVNDRRFRLKDKILDYLGGSCTKCGYNKCKRALHAHHRDASMKSFQISGSHCRSWDKIKAELDKCVLLCSNCHAEAHDLIP